MNTKKCTKCGIEKPLNKEHFNKNGEKYRSECKVCAKAYRMRPEIKEKRLNRQKLYRERKKENPDWKPEREKLFEMELIREGHKQIALLKIESKVHGRFVSKLDYDDWLEINDKYENLTFRIFYQGRGKYSHTRYRDAIYVTAIHGEYGHSPTMRKEIRLHRLIMDVTSADLVVDHIDGDGLNNLRSNLRICTQKENSRNSRIVSTSRSGFKGVHCAKANGSKLPWRARIKHNYKEIQIGTFATKEEAARAYDKKAIELFGEFANLNFPTEEDKKSQ